MKVKALKNLIYGGTFRKAGDIFPMTAEDAADYEKRHWIVLPINKVRAGDGKAPELPASLPPLTVDGKKKK